MGSTSSTSKAALAAMRQGPATGAKPSAFAGKFYQLLVVTVLAAHSQKPVFKKAALLKIGELLLHVVRQPFTFRCQLCQKAGVVLINDLIEECLLGPVALILGRCGAR